MIWDISLGEISPRSEQLRAAESSWVQQVAVGCVTDNLISCAPLSEIGHDDMTALSNDTVRNLGQLCPVLPEQFHHEERGWL